MRMRSAWLFCGMLSFCGCASVKDKVDECVVCIRTCRASARAWRSYKECVPQTAYPKDFRKGFRDGYEDVALGGTGCQPALPPESYWRFCHESAEGQGEMHAWFDGYSHGAAVARQHGVAEDNRIVIAPSVPMPDRLRPPPVRTAAFVQAAEGHGSVEPLPVLEEEPPVAVPPVAPSQPTTVEPLFEIQPGPREPGP